MRILCVDDEPLAFQMLEISIKKASPAVSRKIGDCPIAQAAVKQSPGGKEL